MDANPVFDVSSGRAARLADLREAIRSGSYAPSADAVAESLVGWISPPERFERPVKFSDAPADRNNTEHPRQVPAKEPQTRR